MAPSHHDREEETLIAYFQQMLAEVDDEEFDGELQEQGDMQAAPADESSYSKEANESVLTSANAAIDANHAALASTGAASTIVSAQGEVSSKTIAGSDSLTVSATNAAVVTQSVVSKGLNEQSAPLKTEPSNLESAKASTEDIVISSAADETVSATQAQEQEVATGSSVDRDYDAISKEPFISIDEEEPSTSEFVQIGIQPKAVTSSVTTSSTAAVQTQTVVTTTPDTTEVIHTHTTDDAIVIEKVVSGASVEDAEHVADDKEAQSPESSSDSIAQPSVAESSAQEDAEQSASESGNKSAYESANEIPVDAESAADAAMIAAAEQADKDKADAAAAESAADAAMIAAAEQSDKDKADAASAESAADAAMIAAAEQADKDKADAAAAESAADAAMIAAAEQSEKVKAEATAAAESAADAAMIAAAEQADKDKADAVAAESAADAAMIAAAEQADKDKADAAAAESAADAAMIAAAEQSDKDKADAVAAESAADAAMIAAAQSSADEERSSSAVSYEPQLQIATKTETAKELEFAEPGDSERLQRLLNTIVPQTATETKVAEPELKVETKVAEPEVKVETKVAKPEVKVETKVAKPEVKVEQVQKIEQVTKAPPQTAEQRMADKLHAINKDWKNVDLGEQFQVLFFLVQGVRFAVPLIDLGGIFECDKITNLFGKPSWFMGITDVRGDKINIVDTLRWVKPDIKQSPEKYPYLISLGMSPWSIGCDVLEGNRTLTSSQIKWREIPGNRPWLAGIVTAEKCALLHVKALIALFEAGADIEDLVRNISEEKGDNGTKGTKNA